MMFREKNCFYILYHFLNQAIGNLIHTSYMTHNVYIWMKFAPLYKGVILTVQGKCLIGQDKGFNCTKQMFSLYKGYTRLSFVKDFNQFWTTFLFLSCHIRIAHS